MSGFIDKLTTAFKDVFKSREEKLGVEKGFPLQVCVGLSPEIYPLTVSDSIGDRYLSATYKGNNSWKVEDISVEPEEMGTGINPQGPTRTMTTQQVIEAFDKATAEFPSQTFMRYGETPFANAREQLKAHAAKLEAASVQLTTKPASQTLG